MPIIAVTEQGHKSRVGRRENCDMNMIGHQSKSQNNTLGTDGCQDHCKYPKNIIRKRSEYHLFMRSKTDMETVSHNNQNLVKYTFTQNLSLFTKADSMMIGNTESILQ